MVDKEFKQMLIDRFESWELAEFLQIETAEFVDMFEDDIEINYDDLAEWIGLRSDDDNEVYDSSRSESSASYPDSRS